MRTVLLLLILCGCQADALFRPLSYQLFAPPSVYATWWAATEECVGVRGDFGRVGWGVMEDDSLGMFWAREPDGQGRSWQVLAAGLWVPSHLILLSRSHVGTEYVVRHEMVHELRQVPGHGVLFLDRCSGDFTPLQGRAR